MSSAKLDPVGRATELPRGARFFKTALQVNPFEYISRHSHSNRFADERGYNRALVETCKENGIEVVAVTDHYRIKTARRLLKDLRDAEICAFPGFEAETKEGVHLLCIFDPTRSVDEIDRLIGECGVHDTTQSSPVGSYDIHELLARQKDWNAVCIAAHVVSEKGILRVLSGQARAQAWKHPDLLACSLPSSVGEVQPELRKILQNREKEYSRPRAVAVLNAQDVTAPGDLARSSTWSWIKMSNPSLEGLRQAFLDPDSRIRLEDDPTPEAHLELVAITWQGGFLDGQAIHFNENLNVLIGGRGSGKSTVIESLRYVLDLGAQGTEAQQSYEGLVHEVLRGGTKISLLVKTSRPGRKKYRIERTVPNPPVVRGEAGELSQLEPKEVCRGLELFGQHEIAEIARNSGLLTALLERFVQRDATLDRKRTDVKSRLSRSRKRIVEIREELDFVNERLDSLPALEETLRRFQEAGLEEKLAEKSSLVREQGVLELASSRVAAFREAAVRFLDDLPLDLDFLLDDALGDLPNSDVLKTQRAPLEALNESVVELVGRIFEEIERAERSLADIQEEWGGIAEGAEERFEQTLRKLQRSASDGTEFINLRKQIEGLRPLQDKGERLAKEMEEFEAARKEALLDWEDVKSEQFRELNSAAKKVTRRLRGQVQVEVTPSGQKGPLEDLLRREVGGRLSETMVLLRQSTDLSLTELARAVREGEASLRSLFGLTSVQARALAEASFKLPLLIEELELKPTTEIRLNVGTDEVPVWKALKDLSKGQKATAVLLLLLLESDAPLIVDQPEDDLDNRFVTEGIVPKMREEKQRRQFIFATHNANIPVLGDAELIVGLEAVGEAAGGDGRISEDTMGSIDDPNVQELVEDLLEGGKEAFETRRLKYGF